MARRWPHGRSAEVQAGEAPWRLRPQGNHLRSRQRITPRPAVEVVVVALTACDLHRGTTAGHTLRNALAAHPVRHQYSEFLRPAGAVDPDRADSQGIPPLRHPDRLDDHGFHTALRRDRSASWQTGRPLEPQEATRLGN